MTRDLTPTRADLWRLVEQYGSIQHLASAAGVTRDEMDEWLSGRKEIPIEYYDALLSLVGKLKENK
jgi:hypothetical protein